LDADVFPFGRKKPISMNCEQFKQAYFRFDGANKNVIHWKDVETPHYAAYMGHLQACRACEDWYQTNQLELRGVDPAGYPCIHIAFYVTNLCETHSDPWECPNAPIVYIEQYDEYGIPIRDSESEYWKIDCCPWCGIRLPESKRDLWFSSLLQMGYDPLNDPDSIPEPFKTSEWYRERWSSHRRK
jgi:hypothetical protein